MVPVDHLGESEGKRGTDRAAGREREAAETKRLSPCK